MAGSRFSGQARNPDGNGGQTVIVSMRSFGIIERSLCYAL